MSSRIVLDFVDMYKNYFSYDEGTANNIGSNNFNYTNEPFSSLVKKFENEVVENQARVVDHEVLIKNQLKELESMDDYMGRILKPYIEGALVNGTQIEEAINRVQVKMLEVYGYEQKLNYYKTKCDNSITKLEILKLGIVKSEKIINAERKEAERKEAERRELKEAERRERKEAERKEAERRELERRELKEAERKEAERRELERRELKEAERKEAERKEAERRERKEAERRELERRERKEAERKKEQLNDDLDSIIYSRTSRERIAEIAENRIKKNLNRGKPKIINGSLSFNNRDKYPMDSSQWN